jgi:glutathione S-transferase/alpha,alpha-trehalase
MFRMRSFPLLSVLLSSINTAAFTPTAPVHSTARKGTSSLSMGLTLYGSQGSRSPLVNWGANELDLALSMGDLAVNPHPFGQIPCLADDEDVTVFESGAILQYLYGKATTSDSESRQAAITSWISCK